MEPDEKIRAHYEKCDGNCRPWMIPAGSNDAAAAREIGYKLYKIPKCPKHSIWRGTQQLFGNSIFMSGLRYKELYFGGGLMSQYVNMMRFIHFARTEMECFFNLVSQRKVREKETASSRGRR